MNNATQPGRRRISPDTDMATFATSFLFVNGKPLSFATLPYFVPIINCKTERKMILSARQVGKSTDLSVEGISRSALNSHHTCLYVAPRLDQVDEFSKAKLSTMIMDSPALKAYLVSPRLPQKARSKQFTNFSSIVLRSCFYTASGIRGITANDILFDEVQDILLDNIPIIEECSTRQLDRLIVYAGTPLTFDNTIQRKWDQSTQAHWAVKCISCNYINVPLGMNNIGLKGLICSKCGKGINALEGAYVEFYPTARNPHNFIQGFHINQLMVNGVPGNVPWSRILEKMNDSSVGLTKFTNEVLGYSHSTGSRLVTGEDVDACSDPTVTDFTLDRQASWGVYDLYAGVDWGVQNGNTKTVLVIGGLDQSNKLRTIFTKFYPIDQQPEEILKDIIANVVKAGVRAVGADRGNGQVMNSLLRKELKNFRIRVHEYEYKAKVDAGMTFNAKSKTWIVDRTRAMAGVILDIKLKNMVFPTGRCMDEPRSNLLGLTAEYNEKMRYYQIISSRGSLDDFAHGLVYLRLTARHVATNSISGNPNTTIKLEQFTPGMGTPASMT